MDSQENDLSVKMQKKNIKKTYFMLSGESTLPMWILLVKIHEGVLARKYLF